MSIFIFELCNMSAIASDVRTENTELYTITCNNIQGSVLNHMKKKEEKRKEKETTENSQPHKKQRPRIDSHYL